VESRRGIWWVLPVDARRPGRLERAGVALAARLRERAVPLTAVLAGPPAPELEAELHARRVEVRQLDFRRPWSAATTLLSWLRDARPALVHFHRLAARSPVVATAHLAGARAIVTEHRLPAESSLLDRVLAPFCDRRVAMSQLQAERLAGRVAPGRLALIENGVELDRFLAADPDGVREELGCGERALIACAARLTAEKGIETAIRMMTMLRGRALLAIAGDGDEAPRFRALTAELGLAGDVCFLGDTREVPRLYAASDVVIVPALEEAPFYAAAVEAMAAGKPVVGSDAGALPELVGDAGITVPRRDEGALAGAVSRLTDDPRLARRLGRAGRARAIARFGLPRWLDDTLALYADVCA
jgi:glycosyltransferase involved in cell wall biosynthesis